MIVSDGVIKPRNVTKPSIRISKTEKAWSQPGRYEVKDVADDEAERPQTDETDVPDDGVLGLSSNALNTLKGGLGFFPL